MRKNISETIGPFALVFFCTWTILNNDLSNGLINHPGTTLVVTSMSYTLVSITIARIMPAVSIAFSLPYSAHFSQITKHLVQHCHRELPACDEN